MALYETLFIIHPDHGGTLRELIETPSFFPFRIKPIHADSLVAVSSRLDMLRHGLDDDLVMLRKPTTNSKRR